MPLSYPPGGPIPTSIFLPPHNPNGYIPDLISSLARWLLSRCMNTPTRRLKSPDMHCMLCGQPVCDYMFKLQCSGIQPTCPTLTLGRRDAFADDKGYAFIYPYISHACCTPLCRCEYAVRIKTPGCGHYAGYTCLRKWIMAGQNGLEGR
mgnify:CR=1 FL=1